MFSWFDKPGGSRKNGWGRDRVCSGGETGHDAKELDDNDDTARLATMRMMPETPELTCTGTIQTVRPVVGCGAKKNMSS
jgi:hypothetical protein